MPINQPRQRETPNPVDIPADDPLLRLETETRPPTSPGHWRAVRYPEELTITGITVICPACGARRDWLILNRHNEVSLRCRCSHQWTERELTRADFDAMLTQPGTNHPSLSDAILALGYDGTLAGTYLAGEGTI
ncbi:hypothetical protein [Streptomyces carpaticus]|uniref:Uncharacterized protein n=1 Tax=Streptomyces carpaticus TaxID=285558 RepID=A0ABV4ZGV8_9ACTN